MPEPYYQTPDGLALYHGDCRAVLANLEPESVDCVVTDPPYDLLQTSRNGSQRINKDPKANPFSRHDRGSGASTPGGFMGMAWDATGVAFEVDTWRLVLGVLRPGAHLLAFGGTRTFHRMTCAIEDAGFEVRDCLMWLYGSGFPKSLDVSKAIDKQAGVEREVVGSKKITGCTPDRAIFGAADRSNGKGMGFRPGDFDLTAPATDAARQWEGWGTALKPAWEPIILARKPLDEPTVAANVLRHGTGAVNVDGCRVEGIKEIPGGGPRRAPQGAAYGDLSHDDGKGSGWNPNVGRWPANVLLDEEAAAALDEQSGNRPAGGQPRWRGVDGDRNAFGDFTGGLADPGVGRSCGGASRFFYTAKASRSERGRHNDHPTVKPLDLMRYLIRLVTPPGGIVLDPFAGSGTTGIAARAEGFRAVLIDRDPHYCDVILRRLEGQPMALPLEVGANA